MAACRERQKAEAVTRYLGAPRSCKFCFKPLSYEERQKKFCGHSCAAKHSNSGRAGKLLRKTCAECGRKVRRRKFCFQCSGGALRRVTLEGAKTDSTRKRILMRERPHRCEACSNTVWNGQPIPLELDHIDGDSDNNTRGNLRLICPNCHAQTPTYKSRNRGAKGVRQVSRRLRYTERQDVLAGIAQW